jgi:hypothetical protein
MCEGINDVIWKWIDVIVHDLAMVVIMLELMLLIILLWGIAFTCYMWQ